MNYLSCIEHIYNYLFDNLTVHSRFYYIKNKSINKIPNKQTFL